MSKSEEAGKKTSELIELLKEQGSPGMVAMITRQCIERLLWSLTEVPNNHAILRIREVANDAIAIERSILDEVLK